MKTLCQEIFKKVVEDARNTYLMPDSWNPICTNDLKGNCAGKARGYSQIKINLDLPQEGLEEVIIHEVAHLVAVYKCLVQKVYPVYSPHGLYWQRVCLKLGGNAKRTHSFNLPKARVHKKYDMVCGCCGKVYKVSSRVVSKLGSWKTIYRCKCGSNSFSVGGMETAKSA